MNDSALKKSLIGEEWMALRQVAEGTKAVTIPRSLRIHFDVRPRYRNVALRTMLATGQSGY